MLQFDRNYRLVIGDSETQEGFAIEDLQVRFNIKKFSNNSENADSCSIDIFNLSPEKLALLQVDFPVATFSCGYNGNTIEIFRGQVVPTKTFKSGADRITRIDIKPMFTDLNHKLMSEIVPENGTVEDAIEKIRTNTKLKRGSYSGQSLKENIIYGYPLVGTPRQMIDQVCEVYGLEWRIESDSLIITQGDSVVSEVKETAPVISQTTGMLEEPDYFNGSDAKSEKDKRKRSGVRFKALINPNVVPSSLVKVEYKGKEDFYKVEEVKYSGDYRGNNWYMECICFSRQKEV
jgi:hypothetical protein